MTVLLGQVYSENPVVNSDLFIPFIIYAEILPDPGYGNRWEMIRERERIANLIEMSLDQIEVGGFTTGEDDDVYEIAQPVHFVPAFGQNVPRFTIAGHLKKTRLNDPPPKKIANDVIQLNDNQAITGQGAFNSVNIIPNVWVNAIAKYLRDLFGDSTRIQFADKMKVMGVEVLGIRYGWRGRHFSL